MILKHCMKKMPQISPLKNKPTEVSYIAGENEGWETIQQFEKQFGSFSLS